MTVPVTLDRTSLVATVGPRSQKLTRREFGVIEQLIAAAGAPVATTVLLEKVWRPHTPLANLRVAISNLRRKLEEDPQLPELIITVPGVGYRLAIAKPVER